MSFISGLPEKVSRYKHFTKCCVLGNKLTFFCSPSVIVRNHGTKNNNEKPEKEKQEEKLSLYQRFKAMYRDYWYVLLPVHMVTSAAWFGGIYFAAQR